MAEQDKYGSHFNSNPTNPVKDGSGSLFSGLFRGSGAEQDRHDSHFGIGEDNVRNAASKLDTSKFGSGAEQDRHASHFSLGEDNPDPNNPIDPSTVGIFRSTLLPSIGFHSGLAVVAYAASRATDRVEGKDWLWPSGQILNAWWVAVGYRVVNEGISPATAYSHLAYTEKLLLTGVTAWGARLFYKIASRSYTREGDDPRYEEAKKEEGFWNKAFFSLFLPEALCQAVISLPFTLPFRAIDASAFASPLHVHPEYTHGLAVAMFSTGFAMEVLADIQLAAQKKEKPDDLNREGVWSIVRHPNYLGDALVHASFPLLLWSAGIMHPLALLGPVANYAFLRFAGGDAENETSQEQRYVKESQKKHGQLLEYKRTKNSFWPKPEEISNPWTWTVMGAGVVGLVLEKGVRSYLHR
ncbi:DUF1295-domain-containing protein [Mollisia scopiformis]|uniref:DUF1295-domain-containing protein n=1 Tax=Mollisia scopiformis TaxID=149040 RepID=A0A132BAN1_MOLSC|nr:DUF1295-domain-containing protein [Mollisia scopiformis]KUJ09472.1 DUF1295-domain-containing protein [Mollisia scopiformis]